MSWCVHFARVLRGAFGGRFWIHDVTFAKRPTRAFRNRIVIGKPWEGYTSQGSNAY